MDGEPPSVPDLKHTKEVEDDFNVDIYCSCLALSTTPTRLPWPPEKKLKGSLSFYCLLVRLAR